MAIDLAQRGVVGATRRPFGATPDGVMVDLFTLAGRSGMQAAISNLGGTLVSLTAPDRHGRFADIVLGHDHAEPYALNQGNTYFGALIGRYANRIANGRFTLDGDEHRLAINDPPNSLHGGSTGFNKVVWHAELGQDGDAPMLVLRHESPDGFEGYPGNLTVEVAYTLLPNNTLRIDYIASADRDTIVNLTNHSYFNLTGEGDDTILPSLLTIKADRYTPVDETSIPTGELASVEGTPFDFRTPAAIGQRIAQQNEQLRIGRGYDHNWALDAGGDGMHLAARVEDPRSGRVLTVRTSQPGLQFYSGNQLDGTIIGKSGRPYPRNCAFVLETQHFPDSPNRPNFPSTVLRSSGSYKQSALFEFAVVP